MYETLGAPGPRDVSDKGDRIGDGIGDGIAPAGVDAARILLNEEGVGLILVEPSSEMPIVPIDAITVSTTLPIENETPGRIRWLMNGILTLNGFPGDKREIVELLLSEVVTNAITAMGRAMRQDGRIGFQASLMNGSGGERVLFAIADTLEFSQLPLPRAKEGDESGRGLYLVSSLCRRWGICPHPVGKVVWVEV